MHHANTKQTKSRITILISDSQLQSKEVVKGEKKWHYNDKGSILHEDTFNVYVPNNKLSKYMR